MALSARNQLRGTIEDIQIGDIMAHVVVKVGDNLVESVITRNSAEESETQERRYRSRRGQINRSHDPEGLNPRRTV